MTYLRRDRSRHMDRMQQELGGRLAAVIAHTVRPHDEYEQYAAGDALGVLDKLPDPQAELSLSEPQATRPASVTPLPDTDAPSVRRASLTLEPDRAA